MGVSKELLLEAVAGFLVQDVAPVVGDKGLAFRLKIAANLLSTIAGEVRVDEQLELAARDRLRAVTTGVEARGDRQVGRRAELRELDAALAHALRAGDAPDPGKVRSALRSNLAERLAVINPRFELNEELA